MAATKNDRLPAHLAPIHIEQCIIGGVMMRASVLDEVGGILTRASFVDPVCGEVFEVMAALYERGASSLDFMVVSQELARLNALERLGGMEAVVSLAQSAVETVNMDGKARIVAGAATIRDGIAALEFLIQQARNGSFDTAEDFVDAAQEVAFEMEGAGAMRAPVEPTLCGPLERALERVQKANELKGSAITGLGSGFADLDVKLTGLQPGELIILAARPAMGKSALALQIALRSAQNTGKTALVFSLEMTEEEIMERFYSSGVRVESSALRTGHLSDDQIELLLQISKSLRDVPLIINDSSDQSIASIRAYARRVAADRKAAPLGVIVVDYLQLMSGSSGFRGGSREQEIASISRGLKKLAKDLKIPVIALSQLNRNLESRPSKRPMLSDLRESGSLEQDANVVLFVYRGEVYEDKDAVEGVAEVIIAKNRKGAKGTVKLSFTAETATFNDLAYSSARR